MYNLNCYNWNNVVPKQYIWEITCGYHALRNAVNFYRILVQINNFIDKNNYLNSVYQNQNFMILKSESTMLNSIKEYQKITKKRGNVTFKDLNKIKNKLYSNYPIQILYNLNNVDLQLKENDIKILIMHREKYEISKHWIPIVIHKINNQINLHIIDSFDSTWYGTDLINDIIKILQNKYNITKLNCNNNSVNNFIKMSFTKMIDLSILIIFLFILIYTSFKN
mgnify:CR=1 FL=1|jgi:hypothetical protein